MITTYQSQLDWSVSLELLLFEVWKFNEAVGFYLIVRFYPIVDCWMGNPGIRIANWLWFNIFFFYYSFAGSSRMAWEAWHTSKDLPGGVLIFANSSPTVGTYLILENKSCEWYTLVQWLHNSCLCCWVSGWNVLGIFEWRKAKVLVLVQKRIRCLSMFHSSS
jgi:hypothetical protein